MAATPIPPLRGRRVDFSPARTPPPPWKSLSQGWGGTKTDACRATSVFPPASARISPLPSHPTPMAAASAVVMAQNRFSIFCRRKTTDGGRRRRKGIVPKTALATSAVAERRGETGRSLCCHRKREAVFLRHLGVMMGNIPYYGKQIARTRLCGRSLGRDGLSFAERKREHNCHKGLWK